MMTAYFFLFFVPAASDLLPVIPRTSAPIEAARQGGDRKEEYQRRRAQAAGDVEKLWDLYLWCDAYGMTAEARSCLRAIIELQPGHRQARELLGHVFYDGKWFTTQRALDKYKEEEEKRIAKEQGLVQYKDRWVPAADVPYLERGLVRDEDGSWVSAEDYEKRKAGWVRQDLLWIPPEEADNVAKGLWKCGEHWLELKEADAYHSRLGRWWRIPSEHFLLYTTCDRAVAERALEPMTLAHRDLVRFFGQAPAERVPVLLLRGDDQYNRFAAGDGERAPAELRSLSSIHYAYFADGWFDDETKKFVGAGVCFWDASTESGNRFGPHAVRHAAGLSFVEGLDPSPKTVAKGQGRGGFEQGHVAEFWSEKRLPEWMRYGAAAYVERYYVDPFVAQGGNPYWAREWSVQNIASRGGLRPLKKILETPLSIDDRQGSEKLINERGLVVAFVLDGGCEPMTKALEVFQEALRSGKNLPRAIQNLEKELLKHEAELRRFAGL